jgi:hypothetical protein
VITPLSEAVSVILREFLISLTKYVRSEKRATSRITDSTGNKFGLLVEDRDRRDLQVTAEPNVARSLFVSADHPLESVLPERPLKTGKVIYEI